MKWWEGPDHVMESGVHLHAISRLYPLYAGGRRSILEGVAFGLACLKLMRPSFKPDLIEVDHMPYFPLFTMKLVSLVKRRTMIATWHEVWGLEYWQQYLGTVGGFLAALLERFTVLMPDKIVASSNTTARRLETMMHAKKPIVVVANGIDAELIARVTPSAFASDIIYAGRLLEHKNVDMIIRALALLQHDYPDLRCVIIGDGPERANIERLAKRLNVSQHVQFLGFLADHSEVISHLKASRVFAFPSTREGFGITVLEANASGLPVVTPDYPDNAARDLIKSGRNGLLCAPNPADLAEKLSMILAGKPRFTRKSVTTEAGNYHWTAIAEQADKVWQTT